MKQTTFTLLLFCVIGLLSCRKDKIQLTIKQYDQQQISNYISANGLTGMMKDTVGGDTTGIYYKILSPGTSNVPIKYSDEISFVFSVKTLDGVYTSGDTINNHFYDFAGHITADKLPLGLQTAIINDLKYPGASAHVLIPSHLAYGVGGYGSGSTQIANTRIGGNECLDYYVHVIGNQAAYDDQSIISYMKNNSLTGYTRTKDGLYYSVLTPATGSDLITINSNITATYTAQLFNGTIIDNENAAPYALQINSLVQGVQEGLIGQSVGTKISLLIPSALGYGTAAQTGRPANSCLRFTFVVATVTP